MQSAIVYAIYGRYRDCQTHVRHALRRNLKDTLQRYNFWLIFIPIPAILSREELNVYHRVKQ